MDNLYILVTPKQFKWYGNKLAEMGINPRPFVKAEIAELGYGNFWFKGAPVAVIEKVEGLKAVDFRHLKNNLVVWRKEFYRTFYKEIYG